jgi:putative oxidoreductase
MRSLKATFMPAASYAMVPIRLALFATFFYHGTQKLFGWFGGPGIAGTAGFLGEMGMPIPRLFATFLAITETVASVAFLVGAGVRLFAILIGFVMLVGIFLVHGANGWSFANGGIEFNVTIIGMCLALLLRGPGHASIEWADEEGAAPGAVT